MLRFASAPLGARLAGRIAFGVTLLAGAGVLVVQTTGGRAPHAGATLILTWLLAFVAAAIVRFVAACRVRDPSLAVPAMVLPMVGIALILPLTIHLPVVLAIEGLDRGVAAFDRWALLSIVVTAVPHVVLALLVGRRAAALARGLPAISWERIYWFTIFAACIPFIVLLLIPPVLVAVTGLVALPILRAVEKRALAGRERELPVAIAHVA